MNTAPSDSVTFTVSTRVKSITPDRKSLTLGTQDGAQYGAVGIAKVNPVGVDNASVKWTSGNANVELGLISSGGPDGDTDLPTDPSKAAYASAVTADTGVLVSSGQTLAVKAVKPGIVKLTG
nr:hypothetical protein [Lachnospiraceae bacterium]